MECPSCYDLFDIKLKIPRNLPCGHTYCQFCLYRLMEINQIIECPNCRYILDTDLTPHQLSKNYIAIDIATKQQDLFKKFNMCQIHREAEQFFCRTENIDFCQKCIKNHSGHEFIELEFSKNQLINLHDQIKKQVFQFQSDLQKKEKIYAKQITFLQNQQDQEEKKLDTTIEQIMQTIQNLKTNLIYKLQNIYQLQIEKTKIEIEKINSTIQIINVNKEQLAIIQESLNQIKYISNSNIYDSLQNILELLNKNQNSINNSQLKINYPQLKMEPNLNKFLEKSIKILKEISNPKICYFGEKNKILIYDISHDDWSLLKLDQPYSLEFSYYSCAETLPNGDIIITGGGISNQTIIVSIQKKFMQPMHVHRKEHSMVYLKGFIFVLGGYNPATNSLLKTCEKYDNSEDKWEYITDMNFSKCAFGCTTFNNKYILTFGGYDGTQRLNFIERYDVQKNNWEVLELRLPNSLSNASCFQSDEEEVVILGGGYDQEFCLDLISVNLETQLMYNSDKSYNTVGIFETKGQNSRVIVISWAESNLVPRNIIQQITVGYKSLYRLK